MAIKTYRINVIRYVIQESSQVVQAEHQLVAEHIAKEEAVREDAWVNRPSDPLNDVEVEHVVEFDPNHNAIVCGGVGDPDYE